MSRLCEFVNGTSAAYVSVLKSCTAMLSLCEGNDTIIIIGKCNAGVRYVYIKNNAHRNVLTFGMKPIATYPREPDK